MLFSKKQVIIFCLTIVVVFGVVFVYYKTQQELEKQKTALPETIYLASTEYPPFYSEYIANQGFLAKYITDLFGRQGISVKIDFLPWERAVELTKEGVYDGLCCMWFSEERAKDFIFSKPMAPNELVFFTLDDEDVFDSLDVLSSLRVGLVKEYTYPQELLDATPNTLKSDDEDDLFQMLTEEKVDAVVADRYVGIDIIERLFPTEKSKFFIKESLFDVLPQHLVFPKSRGLRSSRLQEFFDSALEGNPEYLYFDI